MPIKGLTDRGVAFPQIGNIRKGGKKVQAVNKATGKPRVNERGDPVMIQGPDLAYFRVEFDEREVEALEKFNQLYPDGKPTALTILLPFDQIDRVWNPWREAYVAGALLHRCDGEYVNYAIDPVTGEVVIKNGLDASGKPVKCNLHSDPNKAKRCKPTGRLHVIIPELKRLAYLVVHTTSIHDIANISDQLAAIREMNGGHIAGIPLILRRRPIEISTPSGENGKRARRVKSLISIEADPEWVSRKIGQMRLAAMPQLAQIVAPVDAGPSLAALKDYDETDEDDEQEDQIIDGEVVEPNGKRAAADRDAELEEQIMSDAPAPQPEQPRQSYRMAHVKFNGMTTSDWHARCEKFAEEHPNWRKDDGKPDMNHILASIGHAGYETVTSVNVETALIDIVRLHEQKAQS